MPVTFSYKHFQQEAKRLGYVDPVEDNGLAIVGWRNSDGRINKFDCKIALYLRNEVYDYWAATTYPGVHYMRNPLSSKGVATLVPGQYVEAYSLGKYKKYTALKQVKPVSVFRDANKDEVRDEQYLDTGLFGIHIHKAGRFSSLVGNWSAGCQVFQKSEDFDIFISTCQKHAERASNKFTYTLLEY